MSQAKVDEWLHADKGSPWKRAGGGRAPDLATHKQAQNFRAAETDAGRMERVPPDMDWGLDMPHRNMTADMNDPWWAPEMWGGGALRRDDGGAMPDYSGGIGTGPTPTSQTQNPLVQGMQSRYAGMSTEQLQELAERMRGSQQGAMVQQMLMRRRMMPQAQQGRQQQQPNPQQIATPAIQPIKKGGAVRRDAGGGMGMPTGVLNEQERINARQDSGFLHGITPGRADQVQTQAPPGAYVIPADVVAGLGQGNSLAGAKAMQEYIDTGPWGTRLPRGGRGHTIPHPPALPANERSTYAAGGSLPVFHAKKRGKGGANLGATPVDLSDGEFVVSPQDCEKFGYGDRSAGHRHFDKKVIEWRKQHIKKLQTLPGPVKP